MWVRAGPVAAVVTVDCPAQQKVTLVGPNNLVEKWWFTLNHVEKYRAKLLASVEIVIAELDNF